MQREQPLKDIKMKFFQFELDPKGLPDTFEERITLLRKIGKKADRKFQRKYKNLINWFVEYDSLYLLSFCLNYFLTTEEGYDEEAEKGSLAFPPHFQEILQAFSLCEKRSFSGKPLFHDVEKFRKMMRELGDSMIQRLHDIPEKLKTADEVNAYRLRVEMMNHTLAVRGWAYSHQIEKVTEDLCNLINNEFKSIHGVSPWSLFKLFYLMMDAVGDRMNAHRQKLHKVLSQKSHYKICETYEDEFPHLTKMDRKSQDLLWERVGKDISHFRAIMLSHSDLCLENLLSFSLDEIVGLAEGELSKEQVGYLFNRIAYSFSDLRDFEKEHILLDNPVHNKPFIKVKQEKYFTSLWSLLPHISIKILENFIGENNELKDKYNIAKATYLEDEIEKLFRAHFPTAQIYRSTRWTSPSDNKEYENDLLVIIDSFAIVVEAKSGIVTQAAKRGAPERLFKNLQALIEEPSEQALRFIGFLKQHDSEIEFLDKNRKRIKITHSKVKFYIPLGVTFSQLGVISTNLKLLVSAGVTKKKINELISSINLTDLQIVFELLTTQAQKIHYLQRRREFEAHINYIGDEMDLLAFYLDTGFNVGNREFGEKWHFNLILKSKELDPYIINNASGIVSNKPQLKLTKWWLDILNYIELRKPEKWLETCYILLNLHHEDQQEFENLFKRLVDDIKQGKTKEKHNWIIFTSANPHRRFVVIGYPYHDIDKSERNLMMEDMIYNEDKDIKGALVIAVNSEKKHYPYSAIATKLSPDLFDSQFL